MTDLTVCPECGVVAEVRDRFVLESTDGPVEHVRTVCANRHWFVLPAASMPSLPSSTSSSTPSSTEPGARARRAARPR